MEIISKIKSMPITIKAAMAFTVASVLERAIQMITSPIFTRIMTTEQYGTVSLFNSYTEIIGLFALLSLSSGIFNNGMLEYKEDRDSYIASNLVLSNIATLIVLIIVIVLRLLFGDKIIPFNVVYLSIMFILFFVKPAYRFWLGRSKYEYNYKAVLIVSVGIALISSIISIVTTYFATTGEKALGRILGRDVTFFIIYIFLYIKEIKGKSIKFEYIKYAFKYSVPLLPYYLSKYILNHFDQVMIASMAGKSFAGIYSVAYSAGFAIKIIWEAINGAITPWIYEKLNKRNYSSIRKISSQGFLLYSLLSIMVCLCAPEIMKTLASKEYYAGVYCIPPVVCGTFFVGINSWFSIVSFYNKKSVYLSNISMVLAAVNIGLNYFGIKWFGYIAASYTTMICYLSQCYIMYFVANKLAPKAFSLKITLTVSAITVLLCEGSILIFDFYIVRYLAVAIVLLLSLFTYKKFKKIKA